MSRQSFSPSAFLKLLTPGIGIKRWIILILLGAALLGVGVALAVVQVYRVRPDALWPYVLWLRNAPLWLLAGIGLLVGVGSIVLALFRINAVLLGAARTTPGEIITAIVDQKQKQRGPRVVAIGGGTGLPTLLRGLKSHTAHITAIITVADDGGSSGKLRRDLGMLPPGDFRNNIAALAKDEGLMTQLFQYRFGEGGLEGHSFGNLFITAMSGVTGSFEQALIESSRVLAVQGQVLPSTLADITLLADLRKAGADSICRVAGESLIPEAGGIIQQVYIQPEDAPAYPAAVKAILAADVVVLGPGSLFTSILPNLLVRGIAEALRATAALRLYVCNVATQRGETEGYSVGDHIRAIERSAGSGLFDAVVINNHCPPLDERSNYTYVDLGPGDSPDTLGVRISAFPLIDEARPWRHDSTRLAEAIIGLSGYRATPG